MNKRTAVVCAEKGAGMKASATKEEEKSRSKDRHLHEQKTETLASTKAPVHTRETEGRAYGKEVERCAHATAHGHRCRSLAVGDSRYCVAHRKDEKENTETLMLELSQAASSLESPEDVRQVLKEIFRALVEDRITREKAGTLGFLAQMLLRSHREIAFHKRLEQAAADKVHAREELPVSWNVPEAWRGPVEPEDIARAEKELADLKQQAAKEAAESNVGAGLHPGAVECGSPAAAFTVPASLGLTKREPGSRTPQAQTPAAEAAAKTESNVGAELQPDAIIYGSGAGMKASATKEEGKSRSKDRHLHEQKTETLVSAQPPENKLGEHHFRGTLRFNGVKQN